MNKKMVNYIKISNVCCLQHNTKREIYSLMPSRNITEANIEFFICVINSFFFHVISNCLANVWIHTKIDIKKSYIVLICKDIKKFHLTEIKFYNPFFYLNAIKVSLQRNK